MRAATRPTRRGVVATVVTVAVAMLATSCLYFPAAVRHIDASGGTDVPWWCEGPPDLTPEECRVFSAQMDLALAFAEQYPFLADFAATGALEYGGRPEGIGVPFGPTAAGGAFVPHTPNVLLYNGTAPTSLLVGFAYRLSGEMPEGFPGSRDAWVEGPSGGWWLPMWIVRGYENHPDVFAPSHPCLVSGISLTSTADPCYLASHTEPLEVLVTNDDGVTAPGIDALVEGLVGVSGITVDIVAPDGNRSGTGDQTTPGGVAASPATTLSGRAATQHDGFPADSVLHSLQVMGLTPDLVISGINEGQNMGPVVNASGTVGAARVAGRSGVPSIATSQGAFTAEPDFPTGVAATLALLEQWRLGLAGTPFMQVPNINIPSCVEGSSVRGTLDTVVASALDGRSYVEQDCTSTDTVVNDDVDAFNKGYIGIADVGLG